LACRGKNKQSRHHLRQVGLGLLAARNSKLPLYYTVYLGNLHDSRLFEQVCGPQKTTHARYRMAGSVPQAFQYRINARPTCGRQGNRPVGLTALGSSAVAVSATKAGRHGDAPEHTGGTL